MESTLVLVACLVQSSCTSMAEMLFPKEATSRLQHFATEAPQVGDRAPDFTLLTTDGSEFHLAEEIGTRPILLLLGSYTCPVFRYRRGWLRELEREFGDRVRIVVVYTLEAHPVGAPCPYTGEEWDLSINWLAGVRIDQPRDFEQRFADAVRARGEMGISSQVVVDGMDNGVWRQFGRAPTPAFLIDRGGRIAQRQVWFDPDGMRPAIESSLRRR